MVTKKKKEQYTWRGRTLARLAAVQAIFQARHSEKNSTQILQEFLSHRLQRDSLFGVENSHEDGLSVNKKFFSHIVQQASLSLSSILTRLKAILPKNWPLHRIDPVIEAVFIAAAAEYEIEKTPKPVLINEYMNIAHGFFPGNEPRIVNGVLEKLLSVQPSSSHETS